MPQSRKRESQQAKADAASVELTAGPPKQVSESPASSSHHKPRASWFRARTAWPMRDATASTLVRQRSLARRRVPAAAVAKWEMAGPTNIGGRCTALVCDPANADKIWVGSAGGGVWSSQDAGRTWKESWRANTPLEIGSLAVDPSNAATLYCGTGEANLSADSYAGDGVYRSINGGKTWTAWAPSTTTGIPRRVGTVAVDPFDGTHVLVGGIGYGRVAADHDFGGLHETTDGGATWKRTTFVSDQNYWCHCIVFHPRTRGTALATVTGPGTKSGIYRTTDGGKKWTQLTQGLPATERIGRTTLAIAPSNPDIIWALVADASNASGDRVLGVFRSPDRGTTWTNVAGHHFDVGGQMSYGNAIAVHPTDPNVVICGGVDLHATKNGGGVWRVASHWDAKRDTPTYAHADHHAVVMPASAPGRVYTANDGGVDCSDDSGVHWQNRSRGLSVTMFYDIDCAQTSTTLYGGGAQDNGTVITTDGHVDTFFELLGGDGGWMIVDPKEAGHIYATWQFGGMYRFRNNSYADVSPPFKKEESGGVWMVYTTIDPNDSNVVYTGNQRVYRTKNDGQSWAALTPVLDSSPISAIEVAPSDSKTVYVATENGGFFRSVDGGVQWSANLAGPELPGVMITRIETNPADPSDVFITVANFGNSHVFRSKDGGSHWLDIDNGKLPDVPHHALLIRPDAPAQLFVCNDAGVFLTKDHGATWTNATSNLPNVMVVDLVFQTATKLLFAATYGRSIWRLQLA
ncbi:MAG: hypothetical protein QOC57_771 [Ilumatobacteraceae bacterium]